LAFSSAPSYAASIWTMLIARIYEVWMKEILVFHTTYSFQRAKFVADGFVLWFARDAVMS
jgi:hypothetical protein